ncbi:hypothetical protein ACJX0J_011827, partial [Zea mays]
SPNLMAISASACLLLKVLYILICYFCIAVQINILYLLFATSPVANFIQNGSQNVDRTRDLQIF